MPGIIKVKIIAGRDLPVMDRATETADAFVEVRFGQTVLKTNIYPKSLNPHWNSEWFRFEADDEQLQDEPLQMRVMDYDTYSANDAIGKVYIDLKPLLSKIGPAQIQGWLPIFDTLHGIRGEIYLIVRVEIFTDAAKYKQSSCGVDFFSSSGIPVGYTNVRILGFVEELLVNDDPEYQLIDKFRTPRASNEARQTLFSKMSGELVRKIGVKVQDMDGNAVIGYRQCFDLEGETGVVARGIGTAVFLQKPPSSASPIAALLWNSPVPEGEMLESSGNAVSRLQTGVLSSNAAEPSANSQHQPSAAQDIPSRSKSSNDSESDHNSSCGSGVAHKFSLAVQMTSLFHKASFDLLYPFFTIEHFPPSFIQNFGGVVCARSVKLFDQSSQTVTAYGTAAIVFSWNSEDRSCPLDESHVRLDESLKVDTGIANSVLCRQQSAGGESLNLCSLCHVTYYREGDLPFPVKLGSCKVCGSALVPDLLLTTVESVPGLQIAGEGSLVQARLVRMKSDSKEEVLAKEISDALPFIEHQLHSSLIRKLRSYGANAVLKLKLDFAIGEKHMIALATGTAVKLEALGAIGEKEEPAAAAPVNGHQESDDNCDVLAPEFRAAPKFGGRAIPIDEVSSGTNIGASGGASSGGHMLQKCINIGGWPGFAFAKDQESIHMCCRVSRREIGGSFGSQDLGRMIDQMIKTTLFKYRKLKNATLSNLVMNVSVPEEDELEVEFCAMVMAESGDSSGKKTIVVPRRLRTMSGECPIVEETPIAAQLLLPRFHSEPAPPFGVGDQTNELMMNRLGTGTRMRKSSGCNESLLFNRKFPHQIFITSICNSNSPIVSYLGHYDFFFIRETNSLKESGGLGLFLHEVLSEVLQTTKSHVAALGGDGLVSFHFSSSHVEHNSKRNHAQFLLHLAGDVVTVAIS